MNDSVERARRAAFLGWGRAELLVFLPVLGALLGMWGLSIWLAMTERAVTLERAQTQLSSTVARLADFHELAEEITSVEARSNDARREEAVWRALLSYPTASIWVERNGVVADADGQPPSEQLANAVVVREDRDTFAVVAALPQDDALAEWHESLWKGFATLVVGSAAFLLLTRFLIRALRERAAAARQVAVAEQRAEQLSLHKADLEETVRTRTQELRQTNTLLERELGERKVAEANLKEHGALLHAVAKSAAELLGSPSHEGAITAVLELVGRTVGVSHVHLNEITIDRESHLRSRIRYEWCAPGATPMIASPILQSLDLSEALPRTVALLPVGGLSTFFLDEIPEPFRSVFGDARMRSFMQIPVRVEDRLWGSFDFVDSSAAKRDWSWAETDTLQTLAGLIGAAVTRARYVNQLADANMIVQNSPTILYRVRGEPPFPLIYVSHNIGKFGHAAEGLVGNASWQALLMDDDDRKRFAEAMARAIEKSASGATIEFRLRTGDGAYRWVENRYTTVRDKQDRLVEIEGMIIDVTERKAAEERISQLARTDGLTGLANRATYVERVKQAFGASRRGATPFAILYLDLDHFKAINDTLGHPVGDELLREVANRLRGCTRDNDVVARLGGDEFAILQTDMTEPANAGTLAATIQTTLTRPYRIGGADLHVTVSIGISPYSAASAGPDQMIAQADLALYRSKDEGRNRYRFHTDDLDHQVLERVTLADELREAIGRGELEIYYQPQVELASSKIIGMEALVRWHHPKRGLLPAASFIEVAEKTGAIIRVGQWVLDRVCAQLRAWRDAGLALDVVTMNLSLAQLKNSQELLRDVAATLEKYWLVPSDLSFDVTEATLAQITLMRNDVLTELRRVGVGIAIDDFGSAYSSFDYLRTYEVSYLKIAQQMIDEAAGDEAHAATARAILSLAHELGIGVIAGRVETAEQRDHSGAVSSIGQGFFFGDPLTAEDAYALLRRGIVDVVPPLRADTERRTAEGALGAARKLQSSTERNDQVVNEQSPSSNEHTAKTGVGNRRARK